MGSTIQPIESDQMQTNGWNLIVERNQISIEYYSNFQVRLKFDCVRLRLDCIRSTSEFMLSHVFDGGDRWFLLSWSVEDYGISAFTVLDFAYQNFVSVYTGPISTEISTFIAVLRNDKCEVHSCTEYRLCHAWRKSLAANLSSGLIFHPDK